MLKEEELEELSTSALMLQDMKSSQNNNNNNGADLGGEVVEVIINNQGSGLHSIQAQEEYTGAWEIYHLVTLISR